MKTKQKKSKSMSQLAAQLGVSRSTLYAWRDSGAPVDNGEVAVVKWAMSEHRRGADSDEMRAAKLAVLRETERRLKIANDAKAGATMPRSEAEGEAGRAMAVLWQALDEALGYELPAALAGRTALEIQARLNTQLEKLKAAARMEFQKLAGNTTTEDFKTIVLAIETRSALRACEQRAREEHIHDSWQCFMDWKRTDDAQRAEGRAQWCKSRAAAGLPVPDATEAELPQFPGLKRA
jgi:hypothetical protein